MSGHSHWATTKRAKGIKDAARGKIFSKLARNITIAVREGGGGDPSSNYKLRIVIEGARALNMPKENIERAIAKGSGGEGESLNEVVYEGFGPAGVGLIIEATTDNKNRTAQEIKFLLDRNGGTFAGPNAVSFNFETKGYLLVKKTGDSDSEMLTLIDAGAEDVNDTDDGIEVFTDAHSLFEVKTAIEAGGLEVLKAEIIKRPLTTVSLSEGEENKLMTLMELLEEHDDVDRVFVNAA